MAGIQIAKQEEVEDLSVSVDQLTDEVSTKANKSHTHDYGDISGTPTIPTKNSQLENDSNYATKDDIPSIPDIPTDNSQLDNGAGYITSSALSDLEDKVATLESKVQELEGKLDDGGSTE